MCDTRICSACDLAGRDHKCAKIKHVGAEQYHADRGYALAVKKAVKECAEDTEGQFCYICYAGDDEEGLVRGCACRGTSGFAHVSCLARRAETACEYAMVRA